MCKEQSQCIKIIVTAWVCVLKQPTGSCVQDLHKFGQFIWIASMPQLLKTPTENMTGNSKRSQSIKHLVCKWELICIVQASPLSVTKKGLLEELMVLVSNSEPKS